MAKVFQGSKKVWLVMLVAAVLLGSYAWQVLNSQGPGEGFVSGNGRIEATEINIATKMAGRVEEILVREGDFVSAGDVLAQIRIDVLQAQHNEALAMHQEALQGVSAAQAQIALRESDVAAVRAVVVQRQAELEASSGRFRRSQTLAREGAASQQELDDDRAAARSSEAALVASKAQVLAAEAAVEAAKAQLSGARARVKASQATVERIAADIEDSRLVAPRDGRVQLRVAEPGEVLGAGGRVLNLIDLSDVYMTFFLPEAIAGRIAIGSEVRLLMDAAPGYVIPAQVSFVSSTAQFTPKTVETESERQKLMFRVRARISPELLQKHLHQVKTGLPGVAWIRLDKDQPWPAQLSDGLVN